ncbi:uncharacterized protein LOC123221093 isoform X2 [Mangifera indica]|uniref:uncharacterized protein LOC123221093 isoform X2 n=1 Tax=Mangifera indica TaxID=29780 RepID=UPI001CF93AC9|nr:uncharacterized protein LOC123221093 isoform X2 [Mangifera indica]
MQTRGNETHGVHVCHKCGWPFPNPHPSAKHRRAHRKVCGTIEGYKLNESQDLNLSDEDNHSDEDPTTPSPKPVERSIDEKHSSGISKRSNRLEEELFSDAVEEFIDSGLSPGLQHNLEFERMLDEKDRTVFFSFKDSEVTDVSEPLGSSTDGIQTQNPEVPGNTADLLQDNLAPQVRVSNTNEAPVVNVTDDQNRLSHHLVPIKPELLTDASQEIKIINAGEDLTEGLMAHAELEANVKGIGEISSDGDSVLLFPGECTGQTFGLGSNPQEKEITVDVMPSDGNVFMKEEQGAEIASDMSLSEPTTEVDSFEHMVSIDTAQVKVSAQQRLDVAASDNSCKGLNGRGEGKENVHELSVPSDIPEGDNAEVKLQEFKDYKGFNFLQSVTSDLVSSEITKDKKDDVEDPLSVDNCTHFYLLQSSEVTKASASEMNVFEDNLLVEGRVPMINSLSSDGKSDDHHKMLNEVNPMIASLDANAVSMNDSGHHEKGIAKIGDVAGEEENERPRVANYEEIRVKTFEAATNLPEFQVNPATKLHENDEASDHEKAIVEQCDVVAVASRGQSTGGKHFLQTETAFESGSILHESLCDAGDVVNVSETKLLETKFTNFDAVSTTTDVGKQLEIDGNDKAEGECVAEHGRNLMILDRNSEDHAMKDSLVSPSNTEVSIQSSVAFADTKKLGAEESETNLLETKFTNFDAVSTTTDVGKQLEIDGNDKAKGECVAEHGRNLMILDRNSEDHAMKDSLVSPSNTEVSIQSSVAFADTKKLGAEDSGINQSLQKETDNNNPVKHQLGASVIDVSVDSLSQTDSLEGNWGSISVLSTQSDTVPIIDSETLASTDYPASKAAEETNSKNPEGVTERQHSQKSDIFEAPSFMTLVEPGGGVHQKGSASASMTSENTQQQKVPSSQAGWFPSLTNVVNESQGRKKNEEIIAKVTNWSTGKQHTPLKNLLSEANHKTKPKSPNPRENRTPVLQKDETTTEDNGALAPTVSSIVNPGVSASEPAKRDTGKEYNSHASYNADIKREKRKVKGRPYWAQFMCCSSVN